MNVLHVITTINRGGAENHLVELVHGQLASGLGVAVAYLKGDGYWTAALQEAGAEVTGLGLRRYGELAPLWRLRRLLAGFAPDIVHAHMPPAELYVRLALLGSRGGRPPLVISKHNDEPFFRGPGQRCLGRWVARGGAHLIAISDAVNRYSYANLGAPAKKVTTVHYGIDPAPYAAVDGEAVTVLRAAWNVPADAWVIGTVARLVPQKALPVMLEGYAAYRATATRPSRLVLVGRGLLEAELKSLAARLGIGEEVVWAGFREDIPTVMRAFDCFALTSSYEGFGLVLLEAMAAARPVVATAVSAIPEVVADGETGLLCPAGDAAAVAAAFARIEDPALRATLGRAGALRAGERFTLERMVAKTVAIYQECI